MSNNEIKCWLKSVLKSENFVDFSFSIKGNSEKGDGYMGDILYVQVVSSQSPKTYHLVLKCSKKSQELRQSLPVKEAFQNEINLYESIVPAFIEFQRKKNVAIFDSLPKYYGSFVTDETEVLAFENLKLEGYFLCDRTTPLSTNCLKLVLEKYGQWHAISAAMQDQEPEKFKQTVREIKNVWKIFSEKSNLVTFFEPMIEETYDLVKDFLPESTSEKLRNLKFQIGQIINEVINNRSYFCVVTHGDCWNNNFVFKYLENGEATKVAILDWQTTSLSSPLLDISYFIHACASQEDLKKFDYFLRFYYKSFSNMVKLLGSNPEQIFSFDQCLDDLKLFGKYGALLIIWALKVALTDKEQAPDYSESCKSGFENTFTYKNRDEELLKNRMLYIIECLEKLEIL